MCKLGIYFVWDSINKVGGNGLLQGGEGGEESRDGKPGQKDGEGSDPGGAPSSVVRRQPSGINGMPAGQTAPVWGGREAEEPEGGVEGEGGGEDEGGEGVAFCKSVERQKFATAREDFACKLIDKHIQKFWIIENPSM